MKKRIGFLAVIGLVAVGAIPFFNSLNRVNAQDPIRLEHVKGQVIVSVEKGNRNSLKGKGISLSATTTDATNGDDIVLVKSSTATTEQLISKYEDNSAVTYVQPNYIYRIDPVEKASGTVTSAKTVTNAAVTKDYSHFQWSHHDDTKVADSVSGSTIHADAVWNKGKTGSKDVVIAVMDTGIDYTHPDLKDQMWTEGNNIAALKDIGGKYGCSAVAGDDNEDVMDVEGHGTHCAGIIGAAWNGIGTDGVMKNVKLMGVRIQAKDSEYMTTLDIYKGYQYILTAKKAGVNVKAVNCSFGGYYADLFSQRIITELGINNVVVVFAAGNGNVNTDYVASTTGSATQTTTLKVNASNPYLKRAAFSEYGVRTTNLFAPGDAVLSTVWQEKSSYIPCLVDKNLLYESFEEVPTAKEVSVGGGMKFHLYDPTAAMGVGKLVTNSSAKHSFLGKDSFAVPATDDTLATLVSEPTTIHASDKDTLYLGLSMFADTKDRVVVNIQYRMKSGEFSEPTYLTESWFGIWFGGFVPLENVDLDKFQVKLTFENDNDEISTGQVLIDSLGVGTDTVPYEFMSGTSMAAPEITGVVGLLAAEYPKETAEQLVARINGGVRRMDSFKGLCKSEGFIDVEKAFEDPNPEIQSVKQAGREVTLSGRFFGIQKGNVVIDGVSYGNATKWSDTTITFTLASNFLGGLKKVTVVDKESQTGSMYLTLSKTYLELNCPTDVDFTQLMMPQMTTVNDKIYLFGGRDEESFIPVLWSYTPKTHVWEKDTTLFSEDESEVTGNQIVQICGVGKYIYASVIEQDDSGTTPYLYRYDTTVKNETFAKVVVSEYEGFPAIAGGTMVSYKGQLFTVGGTTATSSNGAFISRANFAKGKNEVVGVLNNGRSNPSVNVSGSDLVIVGGDLYDESGTTVEVYNCNTGLSTTYESFPNVMGMQTSGGTIAGTKAGVAMMGILNETGTADTFFFNKLTGKWSEGKEMFDVTKTVHLASASLNNRLYVFGHPYTNSTQVYFRYMNVETEVASTPTPTPTVKPTTPTISKPGVPMIKSAKAKKGKKIVISLTKKVSGAAGYQIVYGTNSAFSKNVHYVTMKGLSQTLVKLKKDTSYFVKVRAYKISSGKYLYGKWSVVKKVKVKS